MNGIVTVGTKVLVATFVNVKIFFVTISASSDICLARSSLRTCATQLQSKFQIQKAQEREKRRFESTHDNA